MKTTKAKLKKYINRAQCVQDDFEKIAHGWGKYDAFLIQQQLSFGRDALQSGDESYMLDCVSELKEIVEKYSN